MTPTVRRPWNPQDHRLDKILTGNCFYHVALHSSKPYLLQNKRGNPDEIPDTGWYYRSLTIQDCTLDAGGDKGPAIRILDGIQPSDFKYSILLKNITITGTENPFSFENLNVSRLHFDNVRVDSKKPIDLSSVDGPVTQKDSTIIFNGMDVVETTHPNLVLDNTIHASGAIRVIINGKQYIAQIPNITLELET